MILLLFDPWICTVEPDEETPFECFGLEDTLNKDDTKEHLIKFLSLTSYSAFCDLEWCSQILQQLQLHVAAHLAFVLQSTNCEPGIQNNILPSSIEQPWWLVLVLNTRFIYNVGINGI